MAITFEKIWDAYDTGNPYVDKKTGAPPKGYENQCAIRVGLALEKAGVSFVNCPAKRVPGAPKSSGMVPSAQALANWLKTKPFAGCPEVQSYNGKSVFDEISGRSGIIFLANYWQRSAETDSERRSGDHIDLWNGRRLTKLFSWFRVHWGIHWDGTFSDFRLADKALFWHIP